MIHVDSTGQRPFPVLRATLMAAAICALAACGGGSSSAPYAGASSSSGGGTGGTGGTGGGTGGGGAGGAAVPDLLFASSYIAYAAQTNGAFLHSVQGGDVYTGGGGSFSFNPAAGGYSSSQTAMNATGLYIFQEGAGTAAPVTSSDYVYVAVSAPGNGTADISQAATLVIQMGNSVTPGASAGHATKFTVDINNAKGSTAATGDCSFDQTLATIGTNVAGPPGSALGVRTYAIPLSSFTCSPAGSLAVLQASGITTVAVKFTGDRNPQMTANEVDNINIGMIGFTGAVSSADTTALGQ